MCTELVCGEIGHDQKVDATIPFQQFGLCNFSASPNRIGNVKTNYFRLSFLLSMGRFTLNQRALFKVQVILVISEFFLCFDFVVFGK